MGRPGHRCSDLMGRSLGFEGPSEVLCVVKVRRLAVLRRPRAGASAWRPKPQMKNQSTRPLPPASSKKVAPQQHSLRGKDPRSISNPSVYLSVEGIDFCLKTRGPFAVPLRPFAGFACQMATTTTTPKQLSYLRFRSPAPKHCTPFDSGCSGQFRAFRRLVRGLSPRDFLSLLCRKTLSGPRCADAARGRGSSVCRNRSRRLWAASLLSCLVHGEVWVSVRAVLCQPNAATPKAPSEPPQLIT